MWKLKLLCANNSSKSSTRSRSATAPAEPSLPISLPSVQRVTCIDDSAASYASITSVSSMAMYAVCRSIAGSMPLAVRYEHPNSPAQSLWKMRTGK